ncbi:heavy metal sensor histidine kinase [Diaphorobacter caeni]|uniref:heavy metal sensor histidine kinase n=1 Tax=Diaphorobacter caeni TaxID=2784387 RepID=UPI00188EB4EF|nr:heavy metal sensor histidine kinase [Diaphorobacter caeni]MBF5005881.1 heavy metal sensor histidine kinase [Diaphorobacter caeni]
MSNATSGVPHLGRRLSRWLALLSMLGLGAVSIAVYLVFDTTLSARQKDMMDQKQRALVHVLADDSTEHKGKSLGHMLTDFLAGHDDYSIFIVDKDGAVLYDSRVPALGSEHTLKRTFAVKVTSPYMDHVHDAVATLVMDRRPDDALLRALAWTLFASMIAGSLLLSLFGGLLVRSSLRPIQSLVAQISELSARDFARRLDGGGLPQELLPLVTQFNALLDRLSDAYRQLESFNADVAHEMNTPLATLISSTEVVLRKPRAVQEMREVLESNLEDLRRIAGIVGDMLFLSRADRGVGARETRVCSLAGVVNDVVEFYEAVALDANLKVEVHGDADARIDAPLMRRAVSNLLSNATRYATSGSTIVIGIDAREQDGERDAVAMISVTNAGADIPQTHLRHLFDRFYRADSARHNADRNHGLGLAIVQAIAKMHGGSTFAQSMDGRTTFGIVVPGQGAG